MRYAMLLVVTFMAAPVWAGQASANPKRNALFGALRNSEPASPYDKLFQAPQAPKPVTPDKTESPKPKVVCGMLLIPADPSIDPKMSVRPPKVAGVEHAMRAITPPVCHAIP